MVCLYYRNVHVTYIYVCVCVYGCIGADHVVTSVSWNHDGTLLAVGTNQNCVKVFDVARASQVIFLMVVLAGV